MTLTQEAADFGGWAAQLLPHSMKHAVRKEIELAHMSRGISREDLEDYADRALTWRMVDLIEPERLEETHRNLAPHGIEDPMRPIGDGAYPLPSERLIVALSLTWAEAELYGRFARLRTEENRALSKKGFGLLAVTTWIVAFERLKIRPDQLDLPLLESQLELAAALLLDLET